MLTSTTAAMRDMRDLLSDPSRWTVAALARDSFGMRLLDAKDPKAVSWCFLGAMFRTVPNVLTRLCILEACRLYSPWRTKDGFVFEAHSVNDRLGHDAVIMMLDRAIEALEAEAEGERVCRLLTTQSDYPEHDVEVSHACA